jgi:hypothetical protein
MLPCVLGSARAIALNIEIMCTFVRARARASIHGDLAKRLNELEVQTKTLALQHDTFSRNTRAKLKQVFDALRELMTLPDRPKRPIGFVLPDALGKKSSARSKSKKWHSSTIKFLNTKTWPSLPLSSQWTACSDSTARAVARSH